MRSRCMQEKMQFNQLQLQNTANLYRKTAFKELLQGMSGVSTEQEVMYRKSLAVSYTLVDCA